MEKYQCLLLIFFGFLSVVNAAKSGEAPREEKYWKCKGKTMEHWEEFPDTFNQCKADVEAHKEEGHKKENGILCESVCMGRRKGVLTQDVGAINRTGANVVVDYHIQPELREELKKAIDGCENMFGETIAKGPTDSACTNYIPFWTCMWLKAMQICETTFDPTVTGGIKPDSANSPPKLLPM